MNIKNRATLRLLLCTGACSLALAAQAGSNLVIWDGFHTQDDVANSGFDQWWFNCSGNSLYYSYGSQSVEGTNGSLELVINWSADGNYMSDCDWFTAGQAANPYAVDATLYSSLDFDVNIDPSSATDANGNYGFITLQFRGYNLHDGGTSPNDPAIGNVTFTTNMVGKWTHVRVPINAATPNMNKVAGLQIAAQPWETGILGSQAIYFENFTLVYNTNPPPRPVISSNTKPLSGLLVTTSTEDT